MSLPATSSKVPELRAVEEQLIHLFRRLFLQCHLRMAVSALQERGVPMACHLGHSLLVHSLVEHGGDKIVPQGVEVEVVREAVLLKDQAQMFCERVRMDELALLVDEQVRAQFPSVFHPARPLRCGSGKR